MIPSNLTVGSVLKRGPTKSSTMSTTQQLIMETICVLPPTVSWTIERGSEAQDGTMEKNDPNTLLMPCRHRERKGEECCGCFVVRLDHVRDGKASSDNSSDDNFIVSFYSYTVCH